MMGLVPPVGAGDGDGILVVGLENLNSVLFPGGS